MSGRKIVLVTPRLAAGPALAALPVRHSLQRAVAQDDVVMLVGAASEVSAQPGAAAATGALAEAAAERGAARAQAAAALAHGDSEDGALAQGAAAAASADPEEGAIAQGALAVASALSANDDAASMYGGGGRAPRSRGRRIRGRGGKDRTKVKKLPSTGSGTTPPALSSLLAAGAVLAAGGAAVLRGRGVLDEVPLTQADR